MNVLIFTLSVLMLLSTMTYNSVQRYVGVKTAHNVYLDYMENTIRGYANEIEDRRYRNRNRSETSKGKGGGGSGNEEKKENKNGMLDISSIESNDLAREIFEALLRNLFGDKEFFVDEHVLVDRILAKKEGLPLNLHKVEHLANVDLDDNQLQEALYRMLRWKGYHQCGDENLRFVLSDLVAFAPSKKIWAYYAHPALLSVVLGGADAAEQLVIRRNEIYHEIKNNDISPKNLKDMEEMLETEVSHFLDSRGLLRYKEMFSFKINKSVPPQGEE